MQNNLRNLMDHADFCNRQEEDFPPVVQINHAEYQELMRIKRAYEKLTAKTDRLTTEAKKAT